MELREFFSEDAIKLDLVGTTKDEILRELIGLLKLDEKSEGMLFKMHGSVEGKDLNEEFFLSKDQAFDFARHATRIAQQYGMPKEASIASMHKQYDEMFEDVRAQLHVKSGDPVKPEHLE